MESSDTNRQRNNEEMAAREQCHVDLRNQIKTLACVAGDGREPVLEVLGDVGIG